MVSYTVAELHSVKYSGISFLRFHPLEKPVQAQSSVQNIRLLLREYLEQRIAIPSLVLERSYQCYYFSSNLRNSRMLHILWQCKQDSLQLIHNIIQDPFGLFR